MKVTAEMLQQANVCRDGLEIFEREWPEGAEVTLANVQRAAELHLDLAWFAYNCFTARALRAFCDATAHVRQAFNEVTAPAWKAYTAAVIAAQDAFGKSEESLDKYGEVLAVADRAYDEATATEWAICNCAYVPAFFKHFAVKGYDLARNICTQERRAKIRKDEPVIAESLDGVTISFNLGCAEPESAESADGA